MVTLRLATSFRSAQSFVRELWREDAAGRKVALLHLAIALSAVGWDLPSSFGWECDGVAPRDVFAMLSSNLTPGSGHNYPLFHALLVLVSALPFLLIALVRFLALGGTLQDAVLQPLTMTGISLTAKLWAVAMSTLTILLLARISRRLFGAAAGWPSALMASTMLAYSYYARTTNLDGPYLFWTVLAIDRFLKALESGARRDYALVATFAALSLATKDQAYASYVLVGLFYGVVLPLWLKGFVASRSVHFRNLGLSALWFLGVYGLASPALLNPTGFLHRLRLLRGANSQDYRSYEPSLQGKLDNLADIARSLDDFLWPWPFLALAGLGVGFALFQAGSPRQRALRLLPACAFLSSLSFFTLLVARSEARFLLPLGIWLSAYVGAGFMSLQGLSPAVQRLAAPALLALVALGPGSRVLALVFTQWGDARRELESRLSQLPPGKSVETYGKLVYQPRFDVTPGARYRVARVDTTPAKRRNPMLGVVELEPPFSRIGDRAPDLIVVQEGWARRYTREQPVVGPNLSLIRRRDLTDDDATSFFRAAVGDRLPGFRLVATLEPRLPSLFKALGQAPIRLHGSTGERIWLLERTGAPR